MKKAAIAFAAGLAVGVASAIIGLRGFASDPLLPEQVRAAIPQWWQILFLALKGSALIWLGAFFLGLLIVVIGWANSERLRRKRG